MKSEELNGQELFRLEEFLDILGKVQSFKKDLDKSEEGSAKQSRELKKYWHWKAKESNYLKEYPWLKDIDEVIEKIN
jgi:hypothetical protein